jgi:hypothetical protein
VLSGLWFLGFWLLWVFSGCFECCGCLLGRFAVLGLFLGSGFVRALCILLMYVGTSLRFFNKVTSYKKKRKTREFVDHLLHCNLASALWSYLFSRFGLSWVMFRRFLDLLVCWWSCGRLRSVAVWKMAPIYLFWCLWKERNNISFEDLERSLEEILSSFCIRCTFGLQPMCTLCLLALMSFLMVFLFILGCFLCILSVY